MRSLLIFSTLPALLLAAHAETTPLDTPLAEQKEIPIACELAKAEPHSNVPVFTSSKESEKAKGTYHYKLWLPVGYLADTQRRWPCMFVMSPNGNASMGATAARLKSGYIVVIPQEAKNGPWEPIVGNLIAAHDDAVQRVRIQEGLKFATGFSGGARMSSLLAQMRPGFSGVICQGAAFCSDSKNQFAVAALRKIPGFAVAIIMGEKDSNLKEVGALKTALPASVKFQSYAFEGGHERPPAELFDKALTWVERQVYEEGATRPELKPIYLARFRESYAAFAAATQPWERYRTADALIALARTRNLATDAGVAGNLRELQAEMLKLRTNPAVSREAMAADAWRRLEETNKAATPAKQAADAAAFSKRYPGTEAAKKAEDAAKQGSP